MTTVPATALRFQRAVSTTESTDSSPAPFNKYIGKEYGARGYWDDPVDREPAGLNSFEESTTETYTWAVQILEPVTIHTRGGWLVIGAIQIVETIVDGERKSFVVNAYGSNGQSDHLQGRWDDTGRPARRDDGYYEFFAEPLTELPEWIAEIVAHYCGVTL